MKAKQTNGVIGGDRPPEWILDELKQDPDLLDAVAAIVRLYRKRSPADINSRR